MAKSVPTLAQVPQPAGAYSNVVEAPAATLVFLAGRVGQPLQGGPIVDGGVGAQTRQALENIGILLGELGLDLRSVVRATVYLTDIADSPAMNAVFGEFFPDERPARTTVGVSAVPAGGSVCIEVVATH